MSLKSFTEYLISKGLNEKSIKEYLLYYRLFEKGLEEGEEYNQEYITKFIVQHPSSTARAFLNNLSEHEDLQIKLPRRTGAKAYKKRRSISPQEMKTLREWMSSNLDKRYLLCLDISYLGALRRAELLNIKVCDLDLDEWVKNTSKPCRLLIRGKRNKERFIPVPSNVMFRVIGYIEQKNKGYDDRLFAFSYMEWQRAFKIAVRSCLDNDYTLHDLRRSRATNWLKEGKDIVSVRNRLGHASVQTTQLYINLDEEQSYQDWAEE